MKTLSFVVAAFVMVGCGKDQFKVTENPIIAKATGGQNEKVILENPKGNDDNGLPGKGNTPPADSNLPPVPKNEDDKKDDKKPTTSVGGTTVPTPPAPPASGANTGNAAPATPAKPATPPKTADTTTPPPVAAAKPAEAAPKNNDIPTPPPPPIDFSSGAKKDAAPNKDAKPANGKTAEPKKEEKALDTEKFKIGDKQVVVKLKSITLVPGTETDVKVEMKIDEDDISWTTEHRILESGEERLHQLNSAKLDGDYELHVSAYCSDVKCTQYAAGLVYFLRDGKNSKVIRKLGITKIGEKKAKLFLDNIEPDSMGMAEWLRHIVEKSK